MACHDTLICIKYIVTLTTQGGQTYLMLAHWYDRCGSYSPGAQGSKMSRAGPKGLKVVSNWKFCAESENQRLTCRTWEVFQIRRHCCHGNNLGKK